MSNLCDGQSRDCFAALAFISYYPRFGRKVQGNRLPLRVAHFAGPVTGLDGFLARVKALHVARADHLRRLAPGVVERLAFPAGDVGGAARALA